VLSRNRKTFAIPSLVLNLFASQIGEFFLLHPVQTFIKICAELLEFSAVIAIFFSFPASDAENTCTHAYTHTHTQGNAFTQESVYY